MGSGTGSRGSGGGDLFAYSARKDQRHQPLAERMRPRNLSEMVGQEHLLGEGQLVPQLAEGAELPSLLLWGPPGTGKTTLARILAEREGCHLSMLSAVSCGVKELRQVMEAAERRRDEYARRSIVFLDEIHRFSKSQQDALLPYVESGAIILIGATTENPSFEVNSALISRTRLLRLESISEGSLRALAQRALEDSERGLGSLGLALSEEAEADLVARSEGDARRLLGTLELCATLASAKGTTSIDAELLAEAAGQRSIRYDKKGDEHYGIVSAFIKSMRASDPDAACYWMTRMLEAGEDPKFVFRRMVIFASEDIGNADPQALNVATSALAAFQFMGLPEGVLPLTQAVTYLACAPKSNRVLKAYGNARRVVRENGTLPVPTNLLPEGYKYPHDMDGSYQAEACLPDKLKGTRIYEPSSEGFEEELQARLQRWRDEVEEE